MQQAVEGVQQLEEMVGGLRRFGDDEQRLLARRRQKAQVKRPGRGRETGKLRAAAALHAQTAHEFPERRMGRQREELFTDSGMNHSRAAPGMRQLLMLAAFLFTL